jgi:hypothetical protein
MRRLRAIQVPDPLRTFSEATTLVATEEAAHCVPFVSPRGSPAKGTHR